jgi:signal transduction histidine kinase
MYAERRLSFGPFRRSASVRDVITGETVTHDSDMLKSLATTLDANAFLTVPLYHRAESVGRLYLAASRPAFGESDIDLLTQVFELVTPVIDNIRLVDRLASDAAEQERQRIARDLHDSVIQPYIGLQLGIAALRQKLTAGADIAGDAERLYELTNEGITDLRGYVSGLRNGGEAEGSLQASIQRFAAKFTEATGIAVDLALGADIRCNDRLAAEVFQMVAEGLSNVRRHTPAARANVVLARNNGCLMLRIENEGTAESPPAPFTPRSLTERATALGGRAHVDHGASNSTAVIVEIPM